MKTLKTFLAAIGLAALSAWFQPVTAVATAETQRGVVLLDAQTAIAEIADALSEGNATAADKLSRLGYADIVRETQTLDGTLYPRYSARTLMETLYRRADAVSAENGRQFLASVYHDTAKRSIGIMKDPAFADLKDLPAGKLATFVPAAEIGVPETWQSLSPASERAITTLADVYSGPNLGRLRLAVGRIMGNPNFGSRGFEKAIAESASNHEALSKMVARGTPPPAVQEALLQLIEEARVGTQAENPALRQAIRELSSELPQNVERYIEAEEQLESRQRQKAEAERVGRNGVVERPSDKALVAALNNPPEPNAGGGGGGGGGGGPAGGTPRGGAPSTGGGGGGGGGGGAPGAAERYASQYSDYNRRSFRGDRPVPRTYARAILSPRAARGVAVGGPLTPQIHGTPRQAYWVPNVRDDRFGRLYVEIKGPQRIAASRVLFSDSFFAATGALWGQNHGDAVFTEGEILILVSMDPDATVDPETEQRLEELIQRGDALSARAERGEDVELEQNVILLELLGLLSERQSQPRGIVTHPALYGRELAWSAVRVDFWLNDLDLLSRESALINGGTPMPAELRDIDLSEAVTWQFYEQAATITLGPVSMGAAVLDVSPHGRFAISIFGEGADIASEELPRLEQLERDLQPMLDWLSANHHDFMRLNDFSEAFALLRWLKANDAQTTVLDMDGQSPAIATPDLVKIGEGPAINE